MRYRKRVAKGDPAVRREWIKGRAEDLARARIVAVRLAARIVAEQMTPDPLDLRDWLVTLH